MPSICIRNPPLSGRDKQLNRLIFPLSGSILSYILVHMVILTESQDCREEQNFCHKNLGATSILQELYVMSWL